jgi:ribosome-binding factor A
MAERRRLERIGQQLREELSALIETSLDDPRVGLVSVTHVHLSKDMRSARVYVSGLGSNTDRKESLQGLDSAKGFLRRQLSLRLPHLQRTPELTFAYDESVESGMRIEELLERLHDEQKP